ncbi:MAG TPA: hypothetical protein ENJ31_05140, partial [Anaerolineae bacterium]|nr:hypothetical protein [Anaerolineae bacterium]
MLPIAEHAFGFDDMLPDRRPSLSVIDPTAGSGRLLVPFQQAGHHVLGVELDARLAGVAARALGKRAVRQGDILAYGSLIPTDAWQVAVINPPYGLWWPIPEDSPYHNFELASAHNIESQHFVLELVTGLLARYQRGLLLGVFSGTFFDHNPRAAAFLGKHYQVVANFRLLKPFEAEYGIGVDAAFVVAIRGAPYGEKQPPLTGTFESGDGPTLIRAVNAAFDEIRRNPYYMPHQPTGLGNPLILYLRAYHNNKLPHVPDLSMAVEVDADALPLRLTARGVSAGNDWAAAWLRFYNAIPLQAYDAAQGTYAPLGEAYGSLPNILMGGVDQSRERLAALGFDVALTDHDAAQIELRARRYARDRLPIRELEPMEYLAYYADGPITAQATAALPGGAGEEAVVLPAGATYELRSRWFRRDEQVGEAKEKGKYLQRTFVDRGYLVLRFTPAEEEHDGVELKPFTVEEINPKAVQALVDAFGLPQVATVEDLPALAGWKHRLARFLDEHQAAAGGRRLYDIQALDAARMATKSSVALLYEMGGGKTATIAHWAALRGYRDVLIVTPASVAPGLIEDLGNWGFPARRLTHGLVSDLLARKRRHRLARQRVKTARQRSSRTAADEALLRHEEDRLRLEAELARKRRHLRNLKAIRRKGKARDPQAIETEIEATSRDLDSLGRQLTAAYAALGDVAPDSLFSDSRLLLPTFYVASYQDLSLGDHLGIFDPWDHDHFDRDGNYEDTVRDLRGARCTCGAPRKKTVSACPRCGASWRGEGQGGGRVCRRCGYVAWTMGQAPKRVLPVVNPEDAPWKQRQARRERIEVRREHRLAARSGGLIGEDVFLSTYHQWPLGRRVKTLFSCVILDESQDAKSKLSLRGAASRGLRANGKAILTGTWIKGYVDDMFWTAGWLLGFGSPLWPFPVQGRFGPLPAPVRHLRIHHPRVRRHL